VPVRVRLTRVGNRKNPIWRVVVADGRSKRDGRVLETVGRYNPQRRPSEIVLDRERIEHWIGKGAQPSETVLSLLRASDRDTPPERARPADGGRRGAAAGRAGGSAGSEADRAEAVPDADAAPDATPAEAEPIGDVPTESADAEEGPTVADAAPAEAGGDVDEEASEEATAAGGG
jgi:small subunit ribosomal protein S16